MTRDPRSFLDRYESLTAGVRRKRLRRSPVLLGAVAEFFSWCDARGVDPDIWTRARHETAWRSRPDALIPVARLPADGFVDAYRAWAEGQAAALVGQERLAASATNDWENDGLTPFAETMKQVHGADRERCMTDREVGGWHPASRWCGGCRLAEPCRSRLRPGVADRRIAAAARGER